MYVNFVIYGVFWEGNLDLFETELFLGFNCLEISVLSDV